MKRTKDQEEYANEWMRTGDTGQMMAERRSSYGRRAADTRVLILTIVAVILVVIYIAMDHYEQFTRIVR